MIIRVIIIKYVFIFVCGNRNQKLASNLKQQNRVYFFILFVEIEIMGVVGNNIGPGNMQRLATVEKEKEKKEEEAMSSSQVFNAWVQLLRSHMT